MSSRSGEAVNCPCELLARFVRNLKRTERASLSKRRTCLKMAFEGVQSKINVLESSRMYRTDADKRRPYSPGRRCPASEATQR